MKKIWGKIMHTTKLKTTLATFITLGSLFIFSGCSASTEQSSSVSSETKIAETIQNDRQKINKQVEKILAEKDNTQKLTDYKKLVTEADTYTQSNNKEKKIVQLYTDSIKKIQTNFKNQDENRLKETQLSNIDQASKNTLTQKIETLKEFKNWIQKETLDVYSQDESHSLTTKIDKSVEEYQHQLQKLEIAEKEAAEKAAAQQAAAQQAAAAPVSSSGYKRDARGRWHRPNGQYASKAEIAAAGLPW